MRTPRENEPKSAKVLEDPRVDTVIRDRDRGDRSGPHIRCPLCRWAPRQKDRWQCKCGHVWNTFDTGGVCPSCLYQWTITMCLACRRWSPHSDWYEE